MSGRRGMRFAVESWAPEYGAAMEADSLEPSTATVDTDVEVPASRWSPRRPAGVVPATRVRFLDGVRRIDARVWITGTDGRTRTAIAASYAAGVACCDDEARVETVAVRRGLFSAAPDLEAVVSRHATYLAMPVAGESVEELSLGLQQRMGELESLVVQGVPAGVDGCELIVVDGPLRSQSLPGCTVGQVKTHQRSYLPESLSAVVERLGPGERTPLFLLTGRWTRYSWYARLPSGAGQGRAGQGRAGHPWAGVVRGEAPGDGGTAEAARLADLATVTLPRFASTPHKDPRAPQNLYPVAALERALRRRLGDATLLYRGLAAAAPRPRLPDWVGTAAADDPDR